MKRKHFYLFALWLPLVSLVLISLGESLLRRYDWHYSEMSVFVLLSGTMGAIQYLLFAAAVTWRFARVDAEFMKRLSWVMPVMFFPVCTIGLWIFLMAISINASSEQVRTHFVTADTIHSFCILFGMYTMMAAYLYVGMIHAIMFLLNKLQLLED
jgi:hypothetical protein